jgi:uncharacterized protein
MKLYSSKISLIAMDIVRILTTDGDMETEAPREVEADIESVLKAYLRTERELTEKAKDRMEAVGGSRQDLGRFKKILADQRNVGTGSESVSYILNQLLSIFMSSPHVDELFSEDDVIRRKVRKVLERHMAEEETLDVEVRDKIKNLQEGTQTWEVEYAKVLEQVKRKRGLT